MSLTRAVGENKAILSGGREAMIDSAAHFIHAAAARHKGACPHWSRTKSYEETTTVTGGRSRSRWRFTLRGRSSSLSSQLRE